MGKNINQEGGGEKKGMSNLIYTPDSKRNSDVSRKDLSFRAHKDGGELRHCQFCRKLAETFVDTAVPREKDSQSGSWILTWLQGMSLEKNYEPHIIISVYITLHSLIMHNKKQGKFNTEVNSM